MTPRAAGRAAPAIKIAILALLLALVAGLAGIPTAGEVAAQTTDYDRDGDGLIEIRTLAQLNAIRWDLNGDGAVIVGNGPGQVSADDAAAYNRAFPGRNPTAPGINGCNGGPSEDACTGYELARNLNFDRNGDGKITERDHYWNDGAGWIPIGAPTNLDVSMAFCGSGGSGVSNTYCYTAIFEGNGNTISNLYINRTINNDLAYLSLGLFGGLHGALRNVGLVNPQISITRSGTMTATRYTNVGGLAGFMGGGAAAIVGSWVDGGSITFIQDGGSRSVASVGCLLGRSFNWIGQGISAITASDATCAVHVTSPLNHTGTVDYGRRLTAEQHDDVTGGKDTNIVYAGGLVGYASSATITASYATGDVACRSGNDGPGGDMRCAGLVAAHAVTNIDSSYATGNVSNEAYFRPIRVQGNVIPGTNQWTTNCERIYDDSFHTAGLVGVVSDNGAAIGSYSTGRVDSAMDGVRCTGGEIPLGTETVNGLGVTSQGGGISSSYWDRQTSGITRGAGNTGAPLTTARLQTPTDYTGIYESWNRDLDGDGELDDPWDFGNAREYPILKYGRDELRIARQRGEAPAPEEPEEYVAPPIVYNLNIRFNVKGLTLDEGESATYRVRMSQSPVGHPARIAVTSNNPDVVVSPTELTFSSANFRQWQTVKVSTLRDSNDTDESATLAHRGPSLSYGSILVTVNDTWPGAATETVNGHTVTVRHTLNAPYGVTVTAPDTLDANTDITIAGAPAGTPEGVPGYGLGASDDARMLADIRVQGTPADGLTICLPVSEALVTEAGEHPLTLLRYADGAWTSVAGAELRDRDGAPALLCAAGITEYGTFAAAYTLPALGAVSDFAAAAGDTPGTITLTWTPGANAERHWLAGVKQSDLSEFAVWAATDDMGSHTVSGLEAGATYIFTVTAGRGEGDTRQWSAWAPWATATAAAPTPTPTPSINAPPSPLPQ